MSLRIGIVVGEISGDNLAVNLIQSLRNYYPDLTFEGILGPALVKENGHSLYPMERLAVMGLIEPLARAREILSIRCHLIEHFIKNPPHIFIGVDAPDFNLRLEQKLKQHGIRTVHYVSPSVWAWRKGRIQLIKKAVDLMLTLFPFEAKFYEEHQVPVCFVGHPLADLIPYEIDQKKAKAVLELKEEDPVIAILPGSRRNELKYLAEIFLQTAHLCFEKQKNLQFVVPLVSEEHKHYFHSLQKKVAKEVPIKVLVGNVHSAIASADAVLVTSGTATLEVMLHKKPMVVAYRMHPITYQIARLLVKVSYISLPNLLAQEGLVPEYIQDKAKPEILAESLMKYLYESFESEKLTKKFSELHLLLKQNASDKAAKAIAVILK